MTEPTWKFRILVNNWVTEGSCIAEHGLCLAISGGDLPDGQFLLWDTGRSKEVLTHNAKAVHLNWADAWKVVLSHSHYDHSGTLVEIAALAGRALTVITHPDTFMRRAKLKPEFRDIGIPFARKRIEDSGLLVAESAEDTPLAGNLFLTGTIPRIHAFEALSRKDLFVDRGGDYVPDPITDDRALVIREPGVGFHLICGCCHSGLLNTLAHAGALAGERRALTIIGGLHLVAYDAEALDRVCDLLAEWQPRRIVPLHCTGLKGVAHLWKRFPGIVEFRGAGDEVRLD
jgi:7,8-dihydropterin-6-yl-methyl-4-(beta-D-ribofuranosyl)aminobenzene 5'-phosphate synthase